MIKKRNFIKIPNPFTLYSLKNKLQAAFAAFAAIVCFILITFFWYYQKNKDIQQIVSLINNISLQIKNLYIYQSDFRFYESINPQFFRTKESVYYQEHKKTTNQLRKNLRILGLKSDITSHYNVENTIREIAVKINAIETLFDNLVYLSLKRGFKDFGLEGKMRVHIHAIEKNKYLSLEKVLALRRIEKDYFLRKEEKYIENLKKAVQNLINEIPRNQPYSQESYKLLENYLNTFLEITQIEKQIGLGGNEGVAQKLSKEIKQLEKEIAQVRIEVLKIAETRNQQVSYTLFAILFITILLTSFLMVLVVRKLSQPLGKLSTAIHQVIQSNFAPNSEIPLINKQDEVGRLSQDVRLMLAKIKERDAELTKQNAKLALSQQTIKKLSEIGRQIISTLDEKQIVKLVFDNLSRLMKNTAVAIGMYDEKNNCLWFAGGENGSMTYGMDSLDNDNLLSVWCFKQQKIVYINDIEKEYTQYVQQIELPEAITQRKSFIYLPLTTNEQKLGVITIQHKEKNAYTSVHADILANIATYTAIALHNARAYQKIEKQHQEIQEKNELVQESILYAKNIQDAMLTSITKIKAYLPQSFVFFKPKDIVSGDFYYFSQFQNLLFIAAVDCTGHGIPGAFMSMVGHNLLNGIIIQAQVHSPEEILAKLHRAIKNTFQQNDIISRDGMDIALLVINKNEKIAEFAGAKSPLIYFQQNKMYEIKGDIFPIGGDSKQVQRTYTKHTIKVDYPTMFYLFSDGYRDQFGGKEGKKLTSARFKIILKNIHQETAEVQEQKLARYLDMWIAEANEIQLDDILVIGLRVE
ncbi:MAG: SpoIIE family protein phosphatase [Microscillaceae bacterium]|nr:SpoIIE family protein phosphatase [Microscillaceae bacterium]MDW8460401.1 SpoIIE family protein phosphatase [Cytophagales bacterium]